MNRIVKNVGSGILGLARLVAFFFFPPWPRMFPELRKRNLRGCWEKRMWSLSTSGLTLIWKKSNQKIQGAVIEDVGKVETCMAKYPKDKTFVFYCS